MKLIAGDQVKGKASDFYNQFSGHHADSVESIMGKAWKTDDGIPICLFYLSREKNGEWIPPAQKDWDNRLYGEDKLEQRHKDGEGGIKYEPGSQIGIIASRGNIKTFLGIFEVSTASNDKCVIFERKHTECEIGKYALFKSTWLFTFDKICDKQVTKDIRGKIKILNAKYKGKDLKFTKDGKKYKNCTSASTLIAGLANAFFENAKTEEPEEDFVNAFQCNQGKNTKTSKIKIGTRDITVNSGTDLDLRIKDITTLFTKFENESPKELELEYSYCIQRKDELETMQQRKQYFENLIGGENIRLTKGNAALFRETVQAPKPDDSPYPRNCIWAGAPGTGKSHKLNKDALKRFTSNNIMRVTFHPEYTYYDFVGTYRPKMSKTQGGKNTGDIEYAFVPGPFAKMLKRALWNRNANYCLIIEEINRANAAAVFGDVFQLLDRASQNSEDGSVVQHESEYAICPSEELYEYLLNEREGDAPMEGVKPAEGIKNELRLPANLFLWATMNSADQGVFPMDTAFKRRWSFENMAINPSEGQDPDYDSKSAWDKIRTGINNLLLEYGVHEDKLMGYYFLKKEERDGEFLKRALQDKVMLYLFEDAAKPFRKHVFKEELKICSQIREKLDLDKKNLGVFQQDVWTGKDDKKGAEQGDGAGNETHEEHAK